jgi:type II secretory pathway pseudopilin PulG
MKLISKTDQNRSRLAFTMVEATVGMGILGIVLLALFATFSFGFGVVRLSRQDLRATQILQEKMEVIRLYKWSDLTAPGYVPTAFTEPLVTNGPTFFNGTISIKTNLSFASPPVYSANLREVIITLSWTNNVKGTNHVLRSRKTRTFVSRYGLQTYLQ